MHWVMTNYSLWYLMWADAWIFRLTVLRLLSISWEQWIALAQITMHFLCYVSPKMKECRRPTSHRRGVACYCYVSCSTLYQCHRIITSRPLQTRPHTICLFQEDKLHLSDLISLYTTVWQAHVTVPVSKNCNVSHLVYSTCECDSTVFQITTELIKGMYEACFVKKKK